MTVLLGLLAQASLLVAPLELGDTPPDTRAVASVRFSFDPAGSTFTPESLAAEPDFSATARHWTRTPSQHYRGAFGTAWRALLPDPVAESVFAGDANERGAVEIWFEDPINEVGECRVFQRIERDAACRQIFVAGIGAAARARAQAILRELRAGADFAQVARERSDDKASALRGGDLAIFERGPDDALLREAAFRAAPGELVGPIASPLGFHVLQRVAVEDVDPRLRDDAWAHARGILIAFGGAQGADPALQRRHDDAERLANELAARIRRGADMRALAREFDDDRGGRERGGDLGWVRRGTSAMPQFFERLFSEPPGSLIGPLPSNAGFVLLRREDPGLRSTFDLRTSAFVDLEQWIRELAETRAGIVQPEAVLAAISAARRLGEALGRDESPGSRMIEALFPRCDEAADFVAACRMLPERVDCGDREVALRELASRYAAALEAAEPYHLRSVWPEHRGRIGAATASLRVHLVTLGEVALDEIVKDLDLGDPRVVLPVFLVAGGPRHAVGSRAAGWSTVSVVAVDEASDSALLESVLRDAARALDRVATRATTLGRVRDGLAPDAGRELCEALIQVECAEVVRRVFDFGRRDELELDPGSSAGAGRLDLVRAAWLAFLSGELGRADAIERIRGVASK